MNSLKETYEKYRHMGKWIDDNPHVDSVFIRGQTLKELWEAIESAFRDNMALESDYIQQGAILEAIEEALDGKEPSDFMQSFPAVRRVWELVYDRKAMMTSKRSATHE